VSALATNADRARVLEQALEASVTGDSSLVAELFTADVRGSAPPVTGRMPALHVSSAVELAVELEDREDACADVVLDVRCLDVGGDRACAEWTASIGATPRTCSIDGITVADFEGARIRAFRHYWNDSDARAEAGP
jgi:hypothetical protein